MKLLYTIAIFIFISTSLSYASNKRCSDTKTMIYRAIQNDRMAFVGGGIVKDGHVLKIFIQAGTGKFYFLLISNDGKEACKVLDGVDFYTHKVHSISR